MPHYKTKNMFTDNKTRAIVIAIENYRFEKISKVKYALNDATAFVDMLKSELNVLPENIKIYCDSYASKTALEDEIKYEIRNLQSDEKFIFYYAGHGFYIDNTNKLTAWDTSDTNFAETTLSLKDILIDPLNESKCKQSLIFLDTCSKYVSDNVFSRETISNINDRELELLLNQSEYCATYLSCSPGEKSYSDDNLQHGIWTFHLLEALKGNRKEFLAENKYITDTSLRDYLRKSVPDFISNKTDIRESQTPFARLNSSHSFIIHEIKPVETIRNNEFPSLDIGFNEFKLYNFEINSVKNATGFKTTHFPPDKVSSAGEHFIQKAFEENTYNEIQGIYQSSRDILSLRRSEMQKLVEIDGGHLETPFFRYDLTVSQNQNQPWCGQFERIITIKDQNVITPEFDQIIGVKMNMIFFNCNIKTDDYETIVEKFENLSIAENGRLVDNDKTFTINYTTIDGIEMSIRILEKRIRIMTKRNYNVRVFIERVESLINSISKNKISILNSGA